MEISRFWRIFAIKTDKSMSEQEMNSYRFASGQEPSDEMLAQIMREVAEEARNRNDEATAVYFANMRRQAEEVKAQWSERINAVINGKGRS